MAMGRRYRGNRREIRNAGIYLTVLSILALQTGAALATSAVWDGDSSVGTPGDGMN